MAITNLKEKDVASLMKMDLKRRQEKLDKYCKDNGIELDSSEDGDKSSRESDKKPERINVDTLTRGIRVQHIDSGLEYTVARIEPSTGEIILRTPTDTFGVGFAELEAEYAID